MANPARKNTILPVLALLLSLVWGVPWVGKQWFASWFDFPWLQWSSAGLTAIICPIGVLLSLAAMAERTYRLGYCYMALFTLPILVMIYCWVIGPAYFAESAMLMQPKYTQFDVIGKLAEAARDEKQVPQERLKAAGFIYREWGIVPVFRGANDQLAVYIPTSEDQQSRQKHLDLRQKAEKSLAVVHWQLKQLPRIALSFLCLSASVFFLGLAVYVFRKPRSAAIVDEGK